MFKAIGKWGASVKANLNLKFITNIFGSKSKSYNNIESDEEEIFSDAREELLDMDEDDEHSDIDCQPRTDVVVNGSAASTSTDLVTVEQYSVPSDRVESNDVTDSNGHVPDEIGDHVEDDETHHNHKDSDLILETNSKPSNGIIRSASSSAFKKVHRRINSYSQRQYSKFEDNVSGGDSQISKDPNDNIDDIDGAIIDDEHEKSNIKSKKSQKRNKVIKRTRRAVRGSWKWFKRGMLGYARTFRPPTLFIFNVPGPSNSRSY